MVDVATLLLEKIPFDATAIGGLTMGADGVSFITAEWRRREGGCCAPSAFEKEVKDHAAVRRVAGALEVGDHVVITETPSPGYESARGGESGPGLRCPGGPPARGRGPWRHRW